MKKRFRIVLLFFTFLSLTSCDFLRRVAGRPTSEQIMEKSQRIELRRKEIADSLQEVEYKKVVAIRKAQDSLALVRYLDSLEIPYSSIFSFGEPQQPLMYKYNAVAGVFRTKKASDAKLYQLQSKGYPATRIYFAGGESAVLLCGGDSVSEVADMILDARSVRKLCPKDTWIYIRPE